MPTLPNNTLDAMLSTISSGTIMTLCTTEPTTRTEAVTTYKLADVSMSGGDYSIADGAVSGRKLTVAEKVNVLVDTTGTGLFVAICDGSDVLLVADCTSLDVTATHFVTFPAFDIEITDPV